MDLIAWLQTLVAQDATQVAAAAAANGVVLFAIIRWLGVNWPTDFKFWFAQIGSFLIPLIAFVALWVLLAKPWDTLTFLNGLFLVASVGYLVSQAIHRLTEK